MSLVSFTVLVMLLRLIIIIVQNIPEALNPWNIWSSQQMLAVCILSRMCLNYLNPSITFLIVLAIDVYCMCANDIFSIR